MKQKFFIGFFILFLSINLFGMEEKEKEHSFIPETNIEEMQSFRIIQDIQSLLKNNPSLTPEDVIAEYLHEKCNNLTFEKIFSLTKALENSEQEKTKKLGIQIATGLTQNQNNYLFQGIRGILKTNPTNNSLGLITNYIFHNYDPSTDMKELLSVATQLKEFEHASEEIQSLSELIFHACNNLIAHNAFGMTELDGSIQIKKEHHQYKYCVKPACDIPAGWFSAAVHKDPVYINSDIPVLNYPTDVNNIRRLTSKTQEALSWLDRNSYDSESIAQIISAKSLKKTKAFCDWFINHSSSEKLVSMKHSPNSNEIALGSSEGKIYFITIPEKFDDKMKPKHFLKQPRHATAKALSFSSVGKLLAAGSGDIHVYDLESDNSQPKATLKEHEQCVTAVIFPHFDENRLVSSSDDKTVRFWNIETETCEDFIAYTNSVSHVTISPDNQEVAACCANTVYFNDPRTKEQRTQNYTVPITSCDYSPDGMQLLVLGEGARIFDIRTGKNYHEYFSHTDSIRHDYRYNGAVKGCFSPCGTKALIFSKNGYQIFDFHNENLMSMHEPDRTTSCDDCCFMPNGNEIVTVGSYNIIGHLFNNNLSRIQLYNAENESLGQGLSAQTALGLRYLEKVAALGEKTTLDNPIAQRMFSPQIQKVLNFKVLK